MDVSKHIKNLLYRYECVVIPDFGAFLTRRISAEIDENTHAFIPPKKSISFNRQLKDNDGLLANHIAQSEGISYSESRQKIRNFTNQLIEEIEAHDRVSLPEIGMFYQQGDKILFHSSLDANFLLEAFGTESFTSSTIKHYEATPITEKDTPVIKLKEEKTVRKNHPATALTNSRTAQKERKSSYWRYAAVGLVAIGLGSFLTANWYSGRVKSHNIAAQEEAASQVENKLQTATFSVENPLPEVEFKVTAKRGKYHIVAGAFRQEKNAEKKLEELKEDGFHPKHIGMNKYGLYQVIYDSYESRIDALKELQNIKTERNPQAWLWVKDL